MTTHHVIPTGLGVNHRHSERTLGICQMHRNFGVAECVKAQGGGQATRRVDSKHQDSFAEVPGRQHTERRSRSGFAHPTWATHDDHPRVAHERHHAVVDVSGVRCSAVHASLLSSRWSSPTR